ncbi:MULTISPECIES: AMP-binding protein [unclassified Haladaptatus]|uniref:class I adenylate-forming enzyme family protein n=1 Tax=unclassified Haladaptatus TaxID=2622732 RepID=UPI00209C4554|nr:MULTISPECIES: AMP-binding protein [unclassified Haladaptatus]MCO8243753.1 AMP-binding protein [Haladaptatus sp. AB643]MCO8256694.1 AMP-binding protein [Haladaptatus sp. AB618]
MNYLEAFDRTARVHTTDTAIVTDDGTEFTYEELDRRSTELANALEARIPSERCAVLTRNGSATVASMIAGQKRGAATVQLPFRGSSRELVSMAETADAAGLIFDDANAEAALSMLDGGAFETAIHVGTRSLDRPDVESYGTVLSVAPSDREEALPDGDECAVFYTSGTTSQPKAVRFDQEQMWLGATQVVMEHGIDETDVALVTTPWYHMVTTDAWLYPHLLAGATLVLHSQFHPDEALELIEEHDVTGMLAVPTQLNALNDAQADANYGVESLSYIRTGGSIVTESLIERTATLLTENVYNTYGLTEGGPNLAFAHPSVQAEHPGTIGKESFVWELRVVEAATPTEHPDPTAVVDAGERGEIIARGPGMSTGYIDNERAERKSYFDGWVRTGDVARVDDDGFLYVVDRVDNMIVSGGENVYPREIERALEEHEAVREVCVFGVDDDHWGEVVTSVVVTEESLDGGSLDAEELDAFCRNLDSLADFKRPRRYAIVTDSLPRTDTGTIQRERLVERHFS